MIVIVVFLLVGRMAGAAKEVAIAWEYGVSEIVDAYVFVFKLAQWPIDILGGVLASVMIPVLARMPQDQPEEMTRFRAEMLGVALGAGLLLGAVFWVALPWLVTQPWVHLASTQAEIAWGMARYLAWIVPLDLVMRLFAAWTMAANRHVNTLTEGIPALTILAAILLSHGGSEPLIWGTLSGVAFRNHCTPFPLHVAALAGAVGWAGFDGGQPNVGQLFDPDRPVLCRSLGAWRVVHPELCLPGSGSDPGAGRDRHQSGHVAGTGSDPC